MNKQNNSGQKVLRFRKSEISLHWALALPFMVCLSTALALVIFYNPDPTRPYRDIVSWVHKISGVSLIILPLVSIVSHRRDIKVYLHNMKHAWSWTFKDIKWLSLMGLAAVFKSISLPEQGKFNAAEKLNFMTLTATYPLYILTGIVIWVTNGVLLPWIVHFGMALMAIPLIAGHLFMATLNPSSRVALPGMITGFVDRHFVEHHHTQWYRENYGHAVESAEVAKKVDPQPIEGSLQEDQGLYEINDPAINNG
jgi:formate dehydrogenase subunit gamma